MKLDHVCKYADCNRPAMWHTTLVLLGSPLKGDTTINVCSEHRAAAEHFILSDENRQRLVNHLVLEGICDMFTAWGMVKHNAAVTFDRIEPVIN